MRNLIYLFLLLSGLLTAQVGINTQTPNATLDVQGNVLIDGSVFLENPGSNDDMTNPMLLLRKQNGEIVQYDINVSSYGPVNTVQFVFERIHQDGLFDFDTRIPIDQYIVTLQGFVLKANNNFNTGGFVLARNPNNIDVVEGTQFYAYENTMTNTWFVRGIVNNSGFSATYTNGNVYSFSPFNIIISSTIFRRQLITKSAIPSTITVDMNNAETAVAPLPTGF